MSIVKALRTANTRMREKNWDKIYVLVDIHDTIFRPCYHNKETFEWYDWAKDSLQLMTNKLNICLILWTSSHEDKIREYLAEFKKHNIVFDYINENPEVENDDLFNGDKKLYFNVGIDDKFGFDAENGDWKDVFMTVVSNF